MIFVTAETIATVITRTFSHMRESFTKINIISTAKITAKMCATTIRKTFAQSGTNEMIKPKAGRVETAMAMHRTSKPIALKTA